MSFNHWVPADIHAPVQCPLPQAERTQGMPEQAWDHIIYVDLTSERGAERAIRIRPGMTWSVADASRPGLHDIVLATGQIGEDGTLIGLSPAFFDGAWAVWVTPSSCRIGEELIPTNTSTPQALLW
ncbi:MAG: hypothetical protein AAFV53_23825 [Myxococcota bacterium]